MNDRTSQVHHAAVFLTLAVRSIRVRVCCQCVSTSVVASTLYCFIYSSSSSAATASTRAAAGSSTGGKEGGGDGGGQISVDSPELETLWIKYDKAKGKALRSGLDDDHNLPNGRIFATELLTDVLKKGHIIVDDLPVWGSVAYIFGKSQPSFYRSLAKLRTRDVSVTDSMVAMEDAWLPLSEADAKSVVHRVLQIETAAAAAAQPPRTKMKASFVQRTSSSDLSLSSTNLGMRTLFGSSSGGSGRLLSFTSTAQKDSSGKRGQKGISKAPTNSVEGTDKDDLSENIGDGEDGTDGGEGGVGGVNGKKRRKRKGQLAGKHVGQVNDLVNGWDLVIKAAIAARSAPPSSSSSSSAAAAPQADFAALYSKTFTSQAQQLQFPMHLVHLKPLHNLTLGENAITIANSGTTWTCKYGCVNGISGSKIFTSTRPDKIRSHFMSDGHWEAVRGHGVAASSLSLRGTCVAEGKRGELTETVRDSHIMIAAQKSIAFSACSTMLTASQMTISTIMAGKMISAEELRKAEVAGLRGLAEVGRRMNLMFEEKQKNKASSRPLLLDRTNVGRGLTRIADVIIDLKIKFYSKALHVSIQLDESTTVKMQSRPVFCGMMGISACFEWFLCFAGQTNTAGCETGATYFKAVKEIYEPYRIWENVRAVGTDGCAAMRSTPEYAGVDAHGEEGLSFVANLKRDLAASQVDPLAYHSTCHMIMLSLGDALEVALPKHWIKHVRLMSKYFCNSVKRKAAAEAAFEEVREEVNELGQIFNGLFDVYGWKMTYPSFYCATRWTGLSKTTDSLVQTYGYMLRMKTKLIDEGFGATERDNGVEIDDEVDGIGDDLVEALDGVAEDIDALLVLDGTNIGNEDAAKAKQDVLLGPMLGVTDLNHGLDSLMSALLKPYTVASTQMQTVLQPIQHRIRRILMNLIRQFEGAAQAQHREPYSSWRNTMNNGAIDKRELVEAVDKVGELFATTTVRSLEKRLEPYMAHYGAMELIDPTAPGGVVSERTWEATKDICERYNLSFVDVKSEILDMRIAAEFLSQGEERRCRVNLLKTYHDRHSEPGRPLALEAFAQVVFTLPVETVFIESLFSIMNYNKDKKRASLADESVASIMHTRDAEQAIADPAGMFPREIRLDLDRALRHELPF